MNFNNSLKASKNENKLFYYGVLVGIILGFLLVIGLIGFIDSIN
ncbi:MAG: hypothetical protein ACFFDK_13150 [Promethearchaeota archaeon]